MLLAILLSLNPRSPEVTVYIDRNGWGFSEEISYFIRKKCRRRMGPKKLPYNSSIKLAKKLYDGIIVDATRSDDTRPDLQKKYVSSRTKAANDSILLEIGEERSEKVMKFLNEFVQSNKLTSNDNGTSQISTKGSCKGFITELSFA